MAVNSKNLATSCVAFGGINIVDPSDSFSFIASWVVVAAMKHGIVHMHSIPDAETEFYFHVITWSDSSHNTALLYFCKAGQPSVCFDETLKIDTKAV